MLPTAGGRLWIISPPGHYGVGIDVMGQVQTFAAGRPDAVTARLASYIDAGARHLVCRIAVLGPDGFIEQLRQLRTVTESLR